MKLVILLPILLFASTAIAENSILGKWTDKSNPNVFNYEFKPDHDFIYILKWKDEGESKIQKTLGVWEIGSWIITSENGSESECNLTIYADSDECCFDFKFIAKNLILTEKYPGGIFTPVMCQNRVLVKDES